MSKVIIGSARKDENGKYTGGRPGDQTGQEVSTQAYYLHDKGWYLFKAKDPAVAKKLAKAMQDACDNNMIGYDQGDRLTALAAYKKYGSLKNIKEPTETDCSALVRLCCMEAGFDPGNFNTSAEPTALDRTGKFEKRESVTAQTALPTGGILVTKIKGHTAIIVSGQDTQSPSDIPVASSAGANGASGKAGEVQKARSRDASKIGEYKATERLNLRYGPDAAKFGIIVTMPKNTKVKCNGYYTMNVNTPWLLVETEIKGKKYTGYASGDYLKR